MDRIVLDTNAAVYLLDGNEEMKRLTDGSDLFISFVTEIELLAYPKLTEKDVARIHSFLEDVEIIGMDDAIRDRTIALKRAYRFELSDALIAATAQLLDIPIITADREFQKAKDEIHVWLFIP